MTLEHLLDVRIQTYRGRPLLWIEQSAHADCVEYCGQTWLRWSRIKRHDPQQRLAVASQVMIGWLKCGGWTLNLDSRAVAKHSGVARTLHSAIIPPGTVVQYGIPRTRKSSVLELLNNAQDAEKGGPGKTCMTEKAAEN